jgi:phosphoribosyl-AMP cyclohydrolase / phosphoribosyl-ATP pyrophosphohydrolase
MKSKKFIPCIYIKNKVAVSGFQDDTIVQVSPVDLLLHYQEQNPDEIIIFNLSSTEEEKEENLLVMKEMALHSQIPLIGAGHIKKMEDVKKILYTGCKKVILNFSKESNRGILKEVSQKFGRDKILISLDSSEEISYDAVEVKNFASEIVVLNRKNIKEQIDIFPLPIILMAPNLSLDKILEYLSFDQIHGLCGDVINANMKDLKTLRDFCMEKQVFNTKLSCSVTWEDLKLNSDQLIPCIVQDYKSQEVLMMAFMNREAFEETLKTGKMNYYSRSRNSQWLKGETSGHYQYVKSLSLDCDNDTLLAKVSQTGVACHTGNISCFYTEIVESESKELNPLQVFEKVYHVIADRKTNPKEGSYTNYLFDKGLDKILKKMGEEATEIIIASKNPNPEEIKYEISDFLYHMMVLMVEKNVTWEDITRELANR